MGKQKFIHEPMRAGVKIPGVEGGTLATEPVPLEVALERMQRVMAKLKSQAPTIVHSIFGQLSHDEWIAINLRHGELHLGTWFRNSLRRVPRNFGLYRRVEIPFTDEYRWIIAKSCIIRKADCGYRCDGLPGGRVDRPGPSRPERPDDTCPDRARKVAEVDPLDPVGQVDLLAGHELDQRPGHLG